MNISKSNTSLDAALVGIPKIFRTRITQSYLKTKTKYLVAFHTLDWDTVGLSASKFTESTLRLLQNELTSTYIPFGQHIPNFPDECRKLIQLPASAGHESLRITIPRALVFLYTLRGKRGIGHVGGDVEANQIDASVIMKLLDWTICDLIRIYHNLSLEDAQNIVNAISTRTIPQVWEIAGKKRILRTDLTFQEKVLLLAYTNVQDGVFIEDLFSWTEYSHFTHFQKRVLQPLHDKRLIEFDKELRIVYLSPLGIRQAEEQLLSKDK